MRHKHRINPGHNGGDYTEGNVISVEVVKCDGNTSNHAMWHYANWRLWGKLEDRLAWKGLAGFYSREEIIEERMRINGRNWGLRCAGRVLTDEHKRAIAESHKGLTHSAETKLKMSQSRKGRESPQKGKARTPEEREKISKTLRGREKSEKTRERMRESQLGKHRGKSWWVNEEGETRFSRECPGEGWTKGRKHRG